MRSNALYFPYIALPQDSWTTKALLYWDKLSSIVPMDHLDRPEQMSEFMRSLLAEGLVEPVIPAQFIHQVERFDAAFIDLIDTRLRRNHRSGSADDSLRRTTRIHVEKLGEIPSFLVESGLAKQIDWAWYDVETTIANQFMSYLAACLGAIPAVNATPVTDKAIFASSLRPRGLQPARQPLHQHKSREVILRHLLPTPAGPVDIDKLLSFKRRHGHLLPPLRASVEAHCTLVATLPDEKDRIEANEAFLLDSRQKVAEIEDAMRPSFGKVVFGSLAPLFGAGLAVQATDPGNKVGYAGAALSLSGAIYQAVSSIRGSRRAAENRPLAYIAHAKREFGRLR
ncbi:hypothetical protein [Deefgea rivuli]|uniref:hypothetical protein n=1 Tax=Deefgea rivuli TaxID=400948 RepID=UPI000483C038|nr:hypothetical protein [Deefgea rivuli]